MKVSALTVHSAGSGSSTKYTLSVSALHCLEVSAGQGLFWSFCTSAFCTLLIVGTFLSKQTPHSSQETCNPYSSHPVLLFSHFLPRRFETWYAVIFEFSQFSSPSCTHTPLWKCCLPIVSSCSLLAPSTLYPYCWKSLLCLLFSQVARRKHWLGFHSWTLSTAFCFWTDITSGSWFL